MVRNRRKSAVMAALLALLVVYTVTGCDESESTPLIGSIPSGISASELRTRLGASNQKWIITEELSDSTNNNPAWRFTYLVAKLDGFSDYGEVGTVHFEFFNDKLVSATFQPQEKCSYESKLRDKGILLKDSGPYYRADVSPRTTIIFHKATCEFIFEDAKLGDEMTKVMSHD